MAPALVGEHVHVVIAAADRSELRPRLAAQGIACVLRDRLPGGALEQRMVHGRIVRAVLAADAEGDDLLDRVCHLGQPIDEAGRALQREVGANRRVSAGDVEPDADDRDLSAVRRDAADGHHVADVTVGHQGRPLGAARDVGELRERLGIVMAEHVDVSRLPD